MRVGLLTTSFPLPDNPVSGIFVARLADRLSREATLTVLTPAGTSASPQGNRARYAVHCFRYAPRAWQLIAHQPGGIPVALRRRRWLLLLLPGFLLGMFLACWRLARRVDVVHANWTATGAVAGLAGRLAGTPVLTTLRGSDVARLERSRLDRALLALCVRTNARLICVSEAIAQQVAAVLPATKQLLSVIPNGVDEQFLAVERPGPNAISAPLRLLAVGNLVAGKSMDLIIEALHLAGARSEARLTIVGEGPQHSNLEALASRLNLGGRVRLEGAQPPETIPGHMAEADVLVLASRSEGRPNAVLEAMAAGLPVIASRIPGVTEIVRDGETGLLFDCGDAQALAGCVLRLEGDPALRRHLGAAGRRYIVEHGLLWEQTAQSYLAAYAAALSGPHG